MKKLSFVKVEGNNYYLVISDTEGENFGIPVDPINDVTAEILSEVINNHEPLAQTELERDELRAALIQRRDRFWGRAYASDDKGLCTERREAVERMIERIKS